MHSGLELTLLLLGCAVLGVVAFRMLHLPPMLGYLAAGVLIGPHALALADDSASTHALAEFGVVFLMFSIGLEFSLAQLKSMRRIVFGLGLSQVVLTIVAAMAFGLFISWWSPTLHVSWQAAFALGGALAMSSTAIVVKMLTERLELESEHGRRIIGILLFQDLAVVPLLILVPALARNTGDLMVTLSLAGMKAVIRRAIAVRDAVEHEDLDLDVTRARKSADAREGVTSFLEKRKPRFTLSPTKDAPELAKLD
jgi:CPA2 family monovalent cation:H+ antiporter-2